MSTSELQEIPPIPEELVDAAHRGRLIIFVGAGFSRLAGSPGWEEFANAVLSHLAVNGALLDSEKDQLSRLASPRRKLSIGVELANKRSVAIPYSEILHPANRSEAEQESERRAFRSLASTNASFVTTNYDKWLENYANKGGFISVTSLANAGERKSKSSVIWRPEEFTINSLQNPSTVFHLHGSCVEPSGMVITTRNYLERYADFDGEKQITSKIRTFLQELFAAYTILFVGYGLDELEILEYVINKARVPNKVPAQLKERKHFLLEAFYSHELRMVDFLTDYYQSQCDVILLPFNKDKRGYKQLIDVVENWCPKLRSTGITGIEKLKDIERLSRQAHV